jgi:hypothetical protein
MKWSDNDYKPSNVSIKEITGELKEKCESNLASI